MFLKTFRKVSSSYEFYLCLNLTGNIDLCKVTLDLCVNYLTEENTGKRKKELLKKNDKNT